MKVIRDDPFRDAFRVDNEPLDRWSFYVSLTVIVAIVVLPFWPVVMSIPGAFRTILEIDVVPIVVYEIFCWKKRRNEQIDAVKRRLTGSGSGNATAGLPNRKICV